jgi:hypothetical protein
VFAGTAAADPHILTPGGPIIWNTRPDPPRSTVAPMFGPVIVVFLPSWK